MTKKKNLYVIEFVSIVFAVTLALVLDEWRQGTKERALLERVMNSIEVEARQNLESVDKAVPYHTELVNELFQGRHVLFTVPVDSLPINVNNDRQLLNFIEEQFLLGQQAPKDRFEIRYVGGQRLVISDDRVWRMEVAEGILTVYGIGNIQLKSAVLSSNAWELAQATDVMLNMPFEVLELMSRLKTEEEEYKKTSAQAIEWIYEARPGIPDVLGDMLSMERKLKVRYEELLELLRKK